MGDFSTWLAFLRDSGGWGLSVVFGVAIVRMWAELKAKDAKVFDLLDKQNLILNAIERMALRRNDTPPTTRAIPPLSENGGP